MFFFYTQFLNSVVRACHALQAWETRSRHQIDGCCVHAIISHFKRCANVVPIVLFWITLLLTEGEDSAIICAIVVEHRLDLHGQCIHLFCCCVYNQK